MNLKIFGKTLLCAYRHIERITEAYEKIVKKIALNSIYSNISGANNTLTITNGMIDLLDRKEKYLNLKIICEETIFKLNDEDKKLLCLIYLDGVNYNVCAKLLNISTRTFFRKKQTAFANFCFQLEKAGYDSKYFLKNYSDDPILSEYFKSFADDKNISEEEERKQNDRMVIKMLSTIEKAYTYKNAYGY